MADKKKDDATKAAEEQAQAQHQVQESLKPNPADPNGDNYVWRDVAGGIPGQQEQVHKDLA